MNKPYVKILDNNGIVTNPINKEYISVFPNRSERRLLPARFKKQNKGINLIIVGKFKYRKIIQEILLKNGSIKRIEHTQLKGVNY